MKKLLITLVAAFTLPTAVFSGIPQNKNPDKWVRINENWTIDTEDVEVKSGKLRFYMKRNEDNTCQSFDLLLPYGIGELIGGSQREESYNKLVQTSIF